MFVYPSSIFEKLEFDKIIQHLQNYCKGDLAKARLENIRFFNSHKKIESLLDEVEQMRQLLFAEPFFPIQMYDDVREDLFLLKKKNYRLDLESVHRIFGQVFQVFQIFQFFESKEKKRAYPILNQIVDQIDFPHKLLKSYQQIFDEEGEIKPNASPELVSIFKKIKSKERELNKQFNILMDQLSNQQFLAENKESYRNGRRVLAVNAEHKRNIDGIIHDQSATGKTVFIEPQEIALYNNALYDLEAEKRQEINKIILKLCDDLRPYVDMFDLWQKILIRLDLIHAKAKFALVYGGMKPKISGKPIFNLKKCFHPLLRILHDKQEKPTIPFSLELNSEKRILVISGPNAGGKSVCLKALGLISLMTQSGMLVPMNEDSVVGIFHKVFVDIGDQQSLEDDLSTYSSRMKNMEVFLNKANKNSLCLIDEFGSGTDPKMGGAIATAILHHLHQKNIIAVINTHYSDIKLFAHHTKGILNGAMLFDQAELQPTYQLKVGNPGSSFAYEIAHKSGLPAHVINMAKKKSGKKNVAVEDLLSKLQKEKKELEDKFDKMANEKSQLQRLIKSYEQAYGDLEFKKMKLKMESKQQKIAHLGETDRELQNLISELRKEKKLEDAKALSKKLREDRKKLISESVKLEEDVFERSGKELKEIKEGSYVKMKSGGLSAKVLSIEGKKAKLEMGNLHIEVPLTELTAAGKPLTVKSRSVITDTVHNASSIETKLDIRGYMPKDALDFIEEFLDNALMGNKHEVKVIHGKGNGTLRKLLMQKLKEYKDVKKVYHPADEQGGNGVTFIQF